MTNTPPWACEALDIINIAICSDQKREALPDEFYSRWAVLVAGMHATPKQIEPAPSLTTQFAEALRESRGSLWRIWAAIGYALCSGKGIESEYAQRVASECSHAARCAEQALATYEAQNNQTKEIK